MMSFSNWSKTGNALLPDLRPTWCTENLRKHTSLPSSSSLKRKLWGEFITLTLLVSFTGKIKPPTDEGAIYSDATLTVLTSKNNANLEVRFSDVYPFSLSTLSYNQQATDVEYLIAEVGFQYKIYEWAEVGATWTTETVS